MRKSHDSKTVGRIQNLLIVCLIASAVFLLLQTGLVRPNSLDSFFTTISHSSVPAADPAELSFHFPVRIAARSGGECTVWMNEDTSGEVFERCGSVLGGALSSASGMHTVGQPEFLRALENDGLFYDFTTPVPLSVLAQRVHSGSPDPALSARILLLSAAQDGQILLYTWEPGKDVYTRFHTALSQEVLQSLLTLHDGQPAEFAFLCGQDYESLSPYTLVPEARPVLREATAVSAIGPPVEDALLTALEFNIHSNARYPESNGAEVVVQGTRTLRFSPDGRVVYHSGADRIPLLYVEHEGDHATPQECVQSVWRVVQTLLKAGGSTLSPYLLSTEVSRPGDAVIQLGYTLEDFPVIFGDGPAITVRIEEDHITDFTLHLRSYTLSEKTSALLPLSLASVTADTETPRSMFPGYFDDGSDTLTPAWLQE